MRPQTQFDTSILDDFSRSCTVHFWPILHICLQYYITIVAVSKKKKNWKETLVKLPMTLAKWAMIRNLLTWNVSETAWTVSELVVSETAPRRNDYNSRSGQLSLPKFFEQNGWYYQGDLQIATSHPILFDSNVLVASIDDRVNDRM